MPRHYRSGDQNHIPPSGPEIAFVVEFARSRDGAASAAKAGYPKHRAADISALLLADVGIRDAVLALVRGKDRSALRSQWEAEDDTALAAAASPDTSLAIKVQATRERLAALAPPSPGELVIVERKTRAVQRAERRAAAQEHHNHV